ncbi:sugar phosphate isomerase/epimerase family protein [Paenibacillus sp. FSL H8-0034]|uniref:sugar phosphate isomerase/epimerase family protein n=1 Tax=Paenibacillus sp. FSL H8-0034 TaxID=2954671 RepID=UPI0030F754A4
MKYAFNSASCPNLTLDEMMAAAQAYGYQGLELRSGTGHRHGAELSASQSVRNELRKHAADSEIELCCLGISNIYSQPENVEAQIDETKSYIKLAHDLGIPYVRVFCGRIPPEGTREVSRHSIIEAFRTLGPYARTHGVTIVAETHDHWSDPRVMADIMREVNDLNVAAAWDVIHTEREGLTGPDSVIDSLGPWIRHVHFHDGLKRLDRLHYAPLGTGEFDQLRIAKALLKLGYEGYVSGEWYNWEPYDIHLPRELAAWKRYVALAMKGGDEDGF